MKAKPILTLDVDDLTIASVWQYTTGDGDETYVKPVKTIPVNSLTGRVVSTKVHLANGTLAWALIGNVDVNNPRLTEHFISLSIFHNGAWFTLARYHDLDAAENGPSALAHWLDLPTDAVFPIAYDIRSTSHGDPAALAGRIELEPRERLSRAQIIALAVP